VVVSACLFTRRLEEQEGDKWVAMLPMNQFGNQLWMLASTHGIAKKRQARWCMAPSEAYTKHLTWVVRPEPCPFIMWNVPLLNWVIGGNGFEIIEDSGNYARYIPAFESSPSQRILAHGCMQSYKYFDEQVPVPFRLRTTRPAKLWVRAQNKTVAIHVRRGDKLVDEGNMPPPPAYYAQALDLLQSLRPGEEQAFVVVTDDPWWVQRQPVFDRMDVLSSKDIAFDMAVISQCKHKILSIGTFGWWGAYLGDQGHNRTQTVIYPVPQMEGRLADGFSNEDYFPAHWVSLNYSARYSSSAP
jgi:galactoside 2-L-fucosyltransferase 1/2